MWSYEGPKKRTCHKKKNKYYFQKNNIKYKLCPKNIDAQNEYIKEAKPDYIVTKKLKAKQKKRIEENYELVTTHSQEYEGKIVKYSLYKKKKGLSLNR